MSVSVAAANSPPQASKAETYPVWPRRRSTAAALLALVLLQVLLFFAVTQRSFFATDDFLHFHLAQDRGFLHYLLTPILDVYPAPGHRLATLLLHELAPLNYMAGRVFLLAALAGTTVVLGQLCRTFARSNEWWTVALLAPFAFSLTLVSPVWWWSNGLPVIPGLFFTAVALSAWLRSYTDPTRRLWLGITVVAVAAAGAFHIKFLLIPIYLLIIRLAILPRLLDVSGGLRHVWKERARWIAIATPPAAFVAVLVLSGLASRSVSAAPGGQPYLGYFGAAWFHALVPVSFLNAQVDAAAPFSATSWATVIASQLLFWGIVAATWTRSTLALRAWALFVVVFAVNAAMLAPARLPGFGVEIAYWLRYYPEVVFFLPLVLALCLRQGAERRPEVAWERTRRGRTAIGALACLFVVSFAVWAPRIVAESDGAFARIWFDNLRADLHAVGADEADLGILESEPPEFVMPSWMANNRLSTVLALLDLDIVSNELSGPTYFVGDDGRLIEATFQPISQLVTDGTPGEGVRIDSGESTAPEGTCLGDGGLLAYHPDATVEGERLAVRVAYAAGSHGSAVLEFETDDPDRPVRRLNLGPFEHDAELVDLGAPRVRALTVEPSAGDTVCFEGIEIGSMPTGEPVPGLSSQAD